MNILVIKPSSLGDIIHTLPAVELIRSEYPDANISWVVSDAFAGVVELYAGVDELIIFKRRELGKLTRCLGLFAFLKDLRQRPYDIAIDFQGLLRSGLMTAASGARQKVGFHNAREGARHFYNEKVMLPANLKHAVDRNVFLVRSALGIAGEVRCPELQTQHDYAKRAKILMKRSGLLTGGPVIAVGPAARWPSKCGPATLFAGAMNAVRERVPDAAFWMLGTADEKPVCEEVRSRCRGAKPVNLAGETNLGTLTELLRQSRGMLTNDSGPMHLAAALGVPTVAFFGSTDPELTGPYGDRHTVFRSHCEASPCFCRECIHENSKCWDGISPVEVADALVARLRRGPSGGRDDSSSGEANAGLGTQGESTP